MKTNSKSYSRLLFLIGQISTNLCHKDVAFHESKNTSLSTSVLLQGPDRKETDTTGKVLSGLCLLTHLFSVSEVVS